MSQLYTIRIFTDITTKCITEFDSPIVPYVGESFYLAGDDNLYRINDVMYSDLNDLQMVDIVVSIDNTYDHLYENKEGY